MDGQTWVPTLDGQGIFMRDEFANNRSRQIRNQYCASRAWVSDTSTEEHACTLRPAHYGNHQCDCGVTWRNELHSQCLGNNGSDTRRYLNLVTGDHNNA